MYQPFKTQQALQILAINFKPLIVKTCHRQGEAPPCHLSKALQMSKLRADITYNHHLYNSPIFVDDANETNKNTGNLNGLKNTKDDDSDVNLEAGLEQIEESLDNEDNKSN
ncbi:hypothetical protein RclHR1_09270001 [Rhizophagus clarus]|uniref:Uncharacterized protein n=1 Tax=Rhizophagus clarus TaxID=94130 RepID=A0A2Z6S412_9GLOM|nr:hypothetical protein RclHR1_09270001 [Rhizophagus clarus]